jgi:hypothetical protein
MLSVIRCCFILLIRNKWILKLVITECLCSGRKTNINWSSSMWTKARRLQQEVGTALQTAGERSVSSSSFSTDHPFCLTHNFPNNDKRHCSFICVADVHLFILVVYERAKKSSPINFLYHPAVSVAYACLWDIMKLTELR